MRMKKKKKLVEKFCDFALMSCFSLFVLEGEEITILGCRRLVFHKFFKLSPTFVRRATENTWYFPILDSFSLLLFCRILRRNTMDDNFAILSQNFHFFTSTFDSTFLRHRETKIASHMQTFSLLLPQKKIWQKYLFFSEPKFINRLHP